MVFVITRAKQPSADMADRHQVVYAACASVLLLALPAAGWGLSGKASQQQDDIQILPQSGSATPDLLRDHYWWNVMTGTS